MNPTIAGDGDIEVTRAQNRNYLLGDGFHRMARESNSFTLLLRYQAQAERHYRRAIEEFERLKALREELPIEPIVESQAEQTETTSSAFQTDPLAPESPPAQVAEGLAPNCQVPPGLKGTDAFSCMSKMPLSSSAPGPWLACRRASF
jgi:hypothetical protein